MIKWHRRGCEPQSPQALRRKRQLASRHVAEVGEETSHGVDAKALRLPEAVP